LCGGEKKHYWRCRAATLKNHSEECFEKAIREENIEHTFMVMLSEYENGSEYWILYSFLIIERFSSQIENNVLKLKKDE